MIRRAAVVLVAVLACGACGDASPEAKGLSRECQEKLRRLRLASTALPSGGSPSAVPGRDSRNECGPVRIDVEGDFDAHVRDALVVTRQETFFGGRLPEVATFLSVAMIEHLKLEDGTRFRVAFNLAPGSYRGDGKYTLTDRGISVPGEGGTVQSPLGSDAFVEVVGSSASPIPYLRFDALSRPCTLETSRKGSSGLLHCRELTASDGRKVSLRWQWDTQREQARK